MGSGYYDDELIRYQRRVVQKAGVHALEEAGPSTPSPN